MRQQLYELLQQCTVRIEAANGHGTGFFVAPGQILTCAHIFKENQPDTTSVKVYWNEQYYSVKSSDLRKKYDLALLAVNIVGHPCVLLHEEANLRDQLTSYGYSDTYRAGDTITCECEGWTIEEQHLLKFKMAQVRPGMSGAPLLNERIGSVCGIVKKSSGRDSDLGGRAITTKVVLQVFADLVRQQQEFHLQDSRWKDCRDWQLPQQRSQKVSAVLWNVVHQFNPFFTGREDILKYLHSTLTSSRVALSGLSGIGKTQVAIEYIYRYRHDYQAVLWARADTHETLVSDFVAIAGLLNVVEKDEQDQSRIILAVKRWLQTNDGWLLILDNADDLAIAMDFIPFDRKGHVLVTTRAQAIDRIAKRMDIEKMKPEEGALFLLHRARILSHDAPLDRANDVDRTNAKEISKIMDGLPLALDQAGAYIEETTCSLSSYLKLYQTRRVELLKRRGGIGLDHPEPVASTLSLSFQRVEQINPAAAELLRLCAFLHPDAIPEEIFTEGASALGPVLQPVAADSFELNGAIGALLKYSLVQRHPDAETLTVHRLVQAVLKDEMKQEMQHQWAERAVRAVGRVFPEIEFTTWQRCERYLPHAQVCATLIEQWKMTFAEAAQLLDRVGNYLRIRAQYKVAEPTLIQALNIREQMAGSVHPEVAASLSELARLYKDQGKYEQAEQFFTRALTMLEQSLGPDHPNIATSLSELAWLYHDQRKYEQAELYFKRALAIRQRTAGIGQPDPDVATSLTDLAWLYKDQGKYEQAEEFFLQASDMRVQLFGRDQSDVATSLTNLAWLYKDQGKYEQAEMAFSQALNIRRHIAGPEERHPAVAISLTDLAWLYKDQGKYAQAENFFRQALAMREQIFGPGHPIVATSLSDLGLLYKAQAKYEPAEEYFRQALAMREQIFGPVHPIVATSLSDLAWLYHIQTSYGQAEPLYQRALAMREQTLASEHPDVAKVLDNYADLLRKTNRAGEAAELEARAGEIWSKHIHED